jgi:hypothetical protein
VYGCYLLAHTHPSPLTVATSFPPASNARPTTPITCSSCTYLHTAVSSLLSLLSSNERVLAVRVRACWALANLCEHPLPPPPTHYTPPPFALAPPPSAPLSSLPSVVPLPSPTSSSSMNKSTTTTVSTPRQEDRGGNTTPRYRGTRSITPPPPSSPPLTPSTPYSPIGGHVHMHGDSRKGEEGTLELLSTPNSSSNISAAAIATASPVAMTNQGDDLLYNVRPSSAPSPSTSTPSSLSNSKANTHNSSGSGSGTSGVTVSPRRSVSPSSTSSSSSLRRQVSVASPPTPERASRQPFAFRKKGGGFSTPSSPSKATSSPLTSSVAIVAASGSSSAPSSATPSSSSSVSTVAATATTTATTTTTTTTTLQSSYGSWQEPSSPFTCQTDLSPPPPRMFLDQVRHYNVYSTHHLIITLQTVRYSMIVCLTIGPVT